MFFLQVDIQDKDGSTALHLASSRGLRDSVSLLIHNGSEVNAEDYTKDTPLHCASLAGHLEVVETLIERGAALTKNEPDGNTAFHYAVVQKRNTIPLIKLLSRSFVGDGDGAANVRNGAGDTPLHHFIKSSFAGPDTLGVLEALILAGANVNIKNLYGERPLSLAVAMAKWEVALMLLCYDADDEVRINNVDGRSIRQYGYLRWKERYESSREVCLRLARTERVTQVCSLAMATPGHYSREEGGGTTLGLLGWVDDYSNVIECVSRFLLSKAY